MLWLGGREKMPPFRDSGEKKKPVREHPRSDNAEGPLNRTQSQCERKKRKGAWSYTERRGLEQSMPIGIQQGNCECDFVRGWRSKGKRKEEGECPENR